MKKKEKQWATETLLLMTAGASVGTALLLSLVKFFAWQTTDSVSMLASFFDSLLDFLASGINLVAVRYALSPPDNRHRFGHGKAESLAGLGQSLFLLGSSFFLLWSAEQRFFSPIPIEKSSIGIGVILFSLMVTILLLYFQRRTIAQTHSVAIRADSLHYISDILSNIAVLCALILASFGWSFFDPFFAAIIAFYLFGSAFHIFRDSIQALLDEESSEETRRNITRIIKSHPNVLGMHDLRTRQSGQTLFIQFHIELDANISFKEAHAIAGRVKYNIQQEFPHSDILVHQDPERT
ncbi:cation diffusion facilitator family transporter [Candidatus Peregrinibacteria bacterium]|nr:MAG: cation diffusion facilitator family transporter [Candidatus Peregrinibacteria bacterium]